MKNLFVLTFLFTSFYGFSEPFHLCYFSLNKKLQSIKSPFSEVGEGVVVKEFYSKLSKPSFPFRNMVKSGERCDGLVISGHHTGGWHGDRWHGRETLSLSFMEKMSCLYPDFFKNVKALWLHGCSTVTDQYLSPFTRDTEKEPVKTADGETVRFIEEHTISKLSRVQNVGHAYSHALDEHTSLSSRYLRIFPNTQIYGFSDAAPSEAQMRRSGLNDIFSHIATLGKIIQQEEEPGKKETLKDQVKRGLEAFVIKDYCIENKVEAWESHNKDTHRLAIENQDYEEIRKLGCDLIKAKENLQNEKFKGDKDKERDKIIKTLNLIHSKGLEKFLFNNILETYQLAKKENEFYKAQNQNTPFFKKIEGILTKQKFKKVLTEKINSPVGSSLRRIDYLKFYEGLHGRDVFFEKARKAHFNDIKNLYLDLKNSRLYRKTGHLRGFDEKSRSLFAITVTEQLRQYDLLTKKEIDELLQNEKLFQENPFISQPIKHKLSYNSYFLTQKNKENHPFLKDLKNNLNEKTFPQTAMVEALKRNDLETAVILSRSVNDLWLDKKMEQFKRIDYEVFEGMKRFLFNSPDREKWLKYYHEQGQGKPTFLRYVKATADFFGYKNLFNEPPADSGQ